MSFGSLASRLVPEPGPRSTSSTLPRSELLWEYEPADRLPVVEWSHAQTLTSGGRAGGGNKSTFSRTFACSAPKSPYPCLCGNSAAVIGLDLLRYIFGLPSFAGFSGSPFFPFRSTT